MEPIKEAFRKVREDIDILREELCFLRDQTVKNREILFELCEIIEKTNEKVEELKKAPLRSSSTYNTPTSTDSTHIPTHNMLFRPLKGQNIHISTGNEGASTDRQTIRQTDNREENSFKSASELLESLDSIKKEIRLKFKKLTEQELLVFSAIYQIEEEEGYSDYKALSKRLGLTESSIRDYVQRLLRKGIPVDKIKINNKMIQLKISENLKKIATLNTILQLRDL